MHSEVGRGSQGLILAKLLALLVKIVWRAAAAKLENIDTKIAHVLAGGGVSCAGPLVCLSSMLTSIGLSL